MLSLKIYSSSKEKADFISEQDLSRNNLIVTDLVSKEVLQEIFFKKHKVLEENCILRANEYWLKLFNENYVDYNIISNALTKALFETWIEQDKISLSKNSLNQFFKVFEQLLPLVISENDEVIISQWFEANPASYIKWGKWYELTKILWNYLLNEKIIPQSCITTFLINSNCIDNLEIEKDYVVDLDVELTFQESELLYQISNKKNVTFLMSQEIYNNSTQYLSCKTLIEKVDQDNITILDKIELKDSKKEFKRFTTQLSEVKDITSKVSAWLSSGAQLEEIAIVLPDIEEYFPVLLTYFNDESIPINKSKLYTANTLRDISIWMNKLKLKSQPLDKSSIELVEYSDEEYIMPYDKFKNKFHLFYSEDDLERSEELKNKYKLNDNKAKNYSKYDFVDWCLGFWKSEENYEIAESILNKLIVDTPSRVELDLVKWFRILDEIVTKKEIQYECNAGGVDLFNLNQTAWLNKKYVYLSGLNQRVLFQSNQQKISPSEILNILNQTGVVLNDLSASPSGYYVKSMGNKEITEIVYSYPETDFMGEVGAPEINWLVGAYSKNTFKTKNIPDLCNFDVKQMKKKESEHERVKLDLGRSSLNLRSIDHLSHMKISNSSLNRYNTCPFIYFTEKILNLQSNNNLDLDEDALSKGSMYHSIVEELVERSNLLVKDAELSLIIEKCREKEGVEYLSTHHWQLYKNKYKKFAKKFIEAEQLYRNEFPSSKVKYLEKKIKYFWDQKNKEISSNSGYPIVSIIDRVDKCNKNTYSLTDYKSTKNSVRSHKSWIEHKNFQLILYYLMYEFYLKENDIEEEFSGLFYYILSDLKRDFGIKIEGRDTNLHSINKKSEGLEEGSFFQLVDEIKDLIFKTVESIEKGEFNPSPKKYDVCNNCNWRNTCRSPHLI